jgi:hypothetical protein
MTDVSSRNLQVRLLVLVFLAFVPALGIFWYANRELRALQLHAKEQDLLQRSAEVTQDYRRLVERGRVILGTLSEFDEIRSVRFPSCTDHLSRIQEHLVGFTTVSVISLDGHLACGSLTPENPLYLADRAYFVRASSTVAFAVGEFALGRITGKPVVGMALPITEGAASGGVVAASMDLEALAERSRGEGLPAGYTVSVLDKNRRLMVRLPRTGDFTLADSVGAIAGPDFPGPPEGFGPRLTVGRDMDGIERLFAVAALRNPNGTSEGYVTVGRPRATLMEEVDDIVGLQLRFLAVGGIVLLALAWALGHFWLARIPSGAGPETSAEGSGPPPSP